MMSDAFYSPFPKAQLPRQPQPGALLLTFESGQYVYRCELRDQDPHGIDCQWFLNGELLQTCRFTVRDLAVQWAERKRRAIIAGSFDWL